MLESPWANICFAIVLVGLAFVLTLWNESTRKILRENEGLDAGERAYLIRRYNRRARTNLLLACVGISIYLVTLVTDNLTLAIAWLLILIAVLFILVQGIADAFDSGLHYQGLSEHYKLQQRLLRRDIEAYEQEQASAESATDE